MTNWTTVNPNQLLPSTLVSAVKAATDALSGALASASGDFSLPSLPSLPSPPDPTAAVINAIIGTLSSLLKGSGIHVLPIPIAKTIPNSPTLGLPPTLDDLQASLGITLPLSSLSFSDAYTSMVTSAGGNAGFFNAFATSLMNPQDPNRPQYDTQTSAVTMAVMLVGAPSYVSITAAASMLDQLTQPTGGNGLAARTVPIPQNTLAKVASGGIQLSWDAPAALFSSPYFPNINMTANRYAVIRSTDASAQNARSVLDFFPTQALTEGMTSGNATVVAIGSGANASFMDTDTLDPSMPVYYAVAWEVNVNESGTVSPLTFDRVSSVAKAIPRAPTPVQTGTSPSWMAASSSIGAFPAIAQAAQSMIDETKILLTPPSDPSSQLNAAMQLAQDATKRATAQATNLLNNVTRLATTLSRPIPSLYITQMSSANGGNAFLLAELSKRLGDTSDGTRPPFDNGEYVCGVCFVAGAPRLADLASTTAFFNAIFGPATPSNPLMGLLAAIDTAVTAAETTVFGPDMKPLPAGTTGIDPTTGKPTVTATPVIADDGTPVTGDSPANPNAGNTNVTPLSELC